MKKVKFENDILIQAKLNNNWDVVYVSYNDENIPYCATCENRITRQRIDLDIKQIKK